MSMLGWIAKNGNLITRRYGSWVFLGEVLINLALTPDRPHTAHCGTCSRCLEACPTAAIPQPYQVESFQAYPWNVAPTLEELANLSPTEYEQRFTGSAFRRIKPWMMRRNAPANLNQSQSQSKKS